MTELQEIQKIRRVAEKLEWMVHKTGEDIEISKYSNAGEDFRFYVNKPYIKSIQEYAEDFGIDEHIEMWIEPKETESAEFQAQENWFMMQKKLKKTCLTLQGNWREYECFKFI